MPGDVQIACGDPKAPPICSVSLEEQKSHKSKCVAGVSFGCYNGTTKMWVSHGCRGVFTCNGKSKIECEDSLCDCAGDASAAQEVWVRRLTNGDLAVAMPNWGDGAAEMTFCLDTLGWKHGDSARARNVWAKKDLGTFSRNFTAKVESHDTLLLRISPDTSSQLVTV